MPFFIDIIYGVRLALRARYLAFLLVAVCSLAISVILAGQFSGRQPLTVALDTGFSVIRFFLPFLTVFMTLELISKDFDRRYYLYAFSCSRSRSAYLFGRFISVVFLVFAALLVLAAFLFLVVSLFQTEYSQATPVSFGGFYLVAISFLMIEVLVVASFCTLLAVYSSSQGFILIGAFGFLLVSRSFSAVVKLLEGDTTLVVDAVSYTANVGALSYLLPDLGGIDVRMISLYGSWEFLPGNYIWLLASNLFYVGVCLFLAVAVLKRKHFS